MSKIVVTADFHLNISNRIDDYIKSLNQISIIANQNELLIILGDIYHTRRPHPVEMNIFRDFINSIKVSVIMIPGNHDINLDASTIDEFYKFKINQVSMFKPPHVMRYKNLVLYLDHGIVEGAKLGPSDLVLHVKNSTTQEELLRKAVADFYLFGDIHKAQVVRKVPPILYPGSIERVDFAERNENKYVLLIDPESKEYTYQKLLIRPMKQLDIKLNETEVINFKQILGENINNAIVKIKIIGTKEQFQKFNEAPLRDALSTLFSYKIMYEKIKEKYIRNKNISESKDMGECFNEYAKIKKFDKYTIAKGLEVMESIQ